MVKLTPEEYKAKYGLPPSSPKEKKMFQYFLRGTTLLAVAGAVWLTKYHPSTNHAQPVEYVHATAVPDRNGDNIPELQVHRKDGTIDILVSNLQGNKITYAPSKKP